MPSHITCMFTLIDSAGYYHEFILRGRPHLTVYMPRRKDARRLVADPSNEVDLYKISRQYPLDAPPAAVSEPTAKRPRLDSNNTAVAAPGITNASLPQATNPLDGVNSTAVLMALLEAKRKQEAEQKNQQAMLESVASLFQGVPQQQQPQQVMQQQHSQQQHTMMMSQQPMQQQQSPAQPNLQALLGLLNQMN